MTKNEKETVLISLQYAAEWHMWIIESLANSKDSLDGHVRSRHTQLWRDAKELRSKLLTKWASSSAG